MSIVVINAVTVSEESRADFEARFAARAGTVVSAPGFEAFELMAPLEGSRYLVYTRWASQEDFAAWMGSGQFSDATASTPSAGRSPPRARSGASRCSRRSTVRARSAHGGWSRRKTDSAVFADDEATAGRGRARSSCSSRPAADTPRAGVLNCLHDRAQPLPAVRRDREHVCRRLRGLRCPARPDAPPPLDQRAPTAVGREPPAFRRRRAAASLRRDSTGARALRHTHAEVHR
jgi:heme-degrading monooxygenase HmoA